VLAIACYVFFFYGLGGIGLIGPDEPRYAAIAREMLSSGDYITPRLYGSPWFEKPVLMYWLAAAGYKIFGINETGARFPAAFGASISVFVVYWCGRKLWGRAVGFRAGLILASSIGWFAFARAASTDMPLAACLTMALMFLLVGLNDTTPQRRLWFYGFYAALGLGILAKGPIALLLPAVLAVTQNYRPQQTGYVLLWLRPPLILSGVIAARLMRRFDNRLVFASGFTVVAIACLINAEVTSAWSGSNFLISQIVIAVGLAVAFTALVGSFVQNAFDTGALSNPINVLTYASFIHCIRLFGGEAGTALMQRLISVREQFHSNMIGLHVDVGNWLTSERLQLLTQGLFPGSAGAEAAQERAALLLGGQVKLQAYTLAYADGYLAIACVAALAIVLIACMKPMKIYFDVR